jgi:flagellin
MEIFSLKTEVDNIANRVTFNGLSLLTGNLSVSTASTIANIVATGETTAVAIDVSKAQPATTYTLTEPVAGSITLTNTTTNVAQTITLAGGFTGVADKEVVDFSALGVKLTLSATAWTNGATAAELSNGLKGNSIVTAAGNGNAVFRVGADVGQDITVTFTDIQTTNLGGANKLSTVITDDQNVSTIAKANTLLSSIDTAVVEVSGQRAKLGAAQNQMEAAVNSLGVVVENLSASESRIRDADIAEISSELTARQIMQQAGVAVLSQANTSSQSVLKLLQ